MIIEQYDTTIIQSLDSKQLNCLNFNQKLAKQVWAKISATEWPFQPVACKINFQIFLPESFQTCHFQMLKQV